MANTAGIMTQSYYGPVSQQPFSNVTAGKTQVELITLIMVLFHLDGPGFWYCACWLNVREVAESVWPARALSDLS